MNIDKALEEFRQVIPPELIKINESMKNHTSFKIGGPADILLVPSETSQIISAVEISKRHSVPYMVMGNGSNLLVRDGGIRGVVIKLADKFSRVEMVDNTVKAQAGILLAVLTNRAVRAGLAGLEFASGIPGTVGGAVVMNAGAYGGEMKDVVQKVTVLDESGTVISLDKEEMAFGYRTSIIQNSPKIVLEVDLLLEYGDYEESRATIAELARRRREKQPLEYPSAGSAFKRPVGYYAGKLIEDSGLKGMRVGDAQISEKHSGFIINLGHASAGDVIELIERVKQRVKERFGVDLQPELKIVGED
ncbi:MAG TPA: UDP-N-acetylmuramate dehydrogenase [Candidatus Atribacteria bacterium]|nr:UDP-N-acetylmuramate dehydrogenase [Candidatus Atribacteria bacterium]HPT79548.1 UDP-N-acetylmuramate dehydrogenase [Candidatus Atribacteria bacterium]